MIRHLCTAHQDLKKVALVNRIDNKKTALWAALQISRSPVAGPSPLSGFPRISKDFQGVARMDHTSRSPQPIYCWCLRLPSDSFQILIRSLSDPHQIPFRSPSDSYHIPFRFPSDPHQLPIRFLSDSYLSGFESISKDFKGVARMDHTFRPPQTI